MVMRARVKKTGEIVELCDKRGDYYITVDSTPYKECELEFGVYKIDGGCSNKKSNGAYGDDDEVDEGTISMMMPCGAFSIGADIEYLAVQVAIAYIVNRHGMSPIEITTAVIDLMSKIKKLSEENG